MMKNKKVLREILSDGGAVVLPTETVYGLFAKALDESAVNHVYELKNRPRDKAMNLPRRMYHAVSVPLQMTICSLYHKPDTVNQTHTDMLLAHEVSATKVISA